MTGVWHVARAVAWRTTKNAFTNPFLLMPTLMFPLFFFAAFAGGLAQVENVPGFEYAGNYTAFQYGFVLLQSAAFSGVFTGFSIARDYESGFGKRLLLAAPRRSGLVFGYWLASVLRWLVVAALLTIVALVAGMATNMSAAHVVGLWTLAASINAAGLLWSAGIAFRFRTIQAGPLMQMPTFFLLFLAPVYVPLDLLSGWIVTAARINPITYVLEAARSLLEGDPHRVTLAFATGFGAAALLAVWAFTGLRQAERAG